jgi:hypothetical protein
MSETHRGKSLKRVVHNFLTIAVCHCRVRAAAPSGARSGRLALFHFLVELLGFRSGAAAVCGLRVNADRDSPVAGSFGHWRSPFCQLMVYTLL